MRLKSWESPRKGRRRNDKSPQASARLRQLKKQRQQLRKRLKAHSKDNKASGPVPGVFVSIDHRDIRGEFESRKQEIEELIPLYTLQ